MVLRFCKKEWTSLYLGDESLLSYCPFTFFKIFRKYISMYVRRHRKRSTVPRRKAYHPRKKVASKKSLVTKSQLYRAIRRNVETKIASNQYTITAFNSGINSSGDLITVLPSILNGTGQADRIGHNIKPLKLVIKGYVVYRCDATASLQDAKVLGARLFCFQDKAKRSYGITSNYNYNLLDLGGTSTNFTGTPMNYVTPHNNDQFMMFADKRMKILKPWGYVSNSSVTQANAVASFNSSIFHPFTITLTQKHLPAQLKYDDSESSSYPVNFAPYLALGYCDLLNASPDTSVTQLAMEFCATLYYEDA
jgi:hypothetical protein